MSGRPFGSVVRQAFFLAIGLLTHNIFFWILYQTVPMVTWGTRPGAPFLMGFPTKASPWDVVAPLLLFGGIGAFSLWRAGQSPSKIDRSWGGAVKALRKPISALGVAAFIFGLFWIVGAFGGWGIRWVIPSSLTPQKVMARRIDETLGGGSIVHFTQGLTSTQRLYDGDASVWDALEEDLLVEIRWSPENEDASRPDWYEGIWAPHCAEPISKDGCFGSKGGVAQMIEHLTYVVLGDTPPWRQTGIPPCRSGWDTDPQDGLIQTKEFGKESFGQQGIGCTLSGAVLADWRDCRGCMHPPEFEKWDGVAGYRLFQRIARLDGGADPHKLSVSEEDLSLLFSRWTLLPFFWGATLLWLGFLIRGIGDESDRLNLSEPLQIHVRRTHPLKFLARVNLGKFHKAMAQLGEAVNGISTRKAEGLTPPKWVEDGADEGESDVGDDDGGDIEVVG